MLTLRFWPEEQGWLQSKQIIIFLQLSQSAPTCFFVIVNIRAKTTSKKQTLSVILLADFGLRKYTFRCLEVSLFNFFFSSFDSLFHTLPPLSLTLTCISPNKDFSSYRPFVPRRNLWSRRDILPCQLTDRQLSNTVHPVQKGAC